MWSVLLWILKIAGVLLLVVCLLVLVFLLTVLFAPIRYQIQGSKYGENMRVQALFSYLDPIVRIYVRYPEEQIVQVRICGILVFPKKEKKPKTDEIRSERQQERQQVQNEKEKIVQEEKPQVQGSASWVVRSKPEGQASDQSVKQEKTLHKTETWSSETEKQSQKISSQYDGICDKVSFLWENRTSVLKGLQIILKAMKTLLPKHCRADIVYGTGEPDVTGYVYAAYCSLSAYLPKGISYEPVWTERILEGDVWMKGRLRLIYFVVAAVRIFANKDIRLLIKKIRSV